MLDFVEVVSGHMSRMVGFDEDALHWISIAVRESVANAMKHGNKGDESKRVAVEFIDLAGRSARRSWSSWSATRARASTPKRSPIRWPPRTC